MSLYSEQFLVKKIGVFFLWILFLAITFNCQKCPTGPDEEKKMDPNFRGQLVSDFVRAILKPDGTVWAWGPGFEGTLGNGSLDPSDTPVQVLRLKNIISIDFDGGRGAAADLDGNIWFWGNNMWYLEEPGKDTTIVVPIKISKKVGVKKIEFLMVDINMLCDDGTIWTITTNPETPSKYLKPYKKYQVTDIVQISESLALKSDGTIVELLYTDPDIGGIVPGIEGVIHLSNVFMRRTLIIKSDSTVWGWGRNDYGQLGDGTFIQRTEPVQIDHLNHVIQISSNADYNLGITKDGKPIFWGLEKPHSEPPVGLAMPKIIDSLTNIELIEAFTRSLIMTMDGQYWIYYTDTDILEQIILPVSAALNSEYINKDYFIVR